MDNYVGAQVGPVRPDERSGLDSNTDEFAPIRTNRLKDAPVQMRLQISLSDRAIRELEPHAKAGQRLDAANSHHG